MPEKVDIGLETAKITVLFPVVEKAVTGKLVEESFKHQRNIEILKAPNIIEPDAVAFLGDREALFEEHRSPANTEQKLPPEWQQNNFKEEITRIVKAAVEQVKGADIVTFTGGRDYEPLLLDNPPDGNLRHEKTQDYSAFDARDVVETYMLLTAIAEGKTVHSTCRGYQMVASNMMDIFSGEEAVPIIQHIPDFIEKHGKQGIATDHHTGKALGKGMDAIITEHGDAWFQKILYAQQHGLPPAAGLGDIDGTSHDVLVDNKSLLYDALALVQGDDNKKIKDCNGKDCEATVASLHHQGWVIPKGEKDAFKNALAKAGGEVIAISSDERDSGVDVIEGIKFSKIIDQDAIEKLQDKLVRLNKKLGLDIEIPMPEIKEGQAIRFDVVHGAQAHPEVNIAGAALMIPALTTAYARAKKEALAHDQDIGGYDAWRETVDLEQLPEVQNARSAGHTKPSSQRPLIMLNRAGLRSDRDEPLDKGFAYESKEELVGAVVSAYDKTLQKISEQSAITFIKNTPERVVDEIYNGVAIEEPYPKHNSFRQALQNAETYGEMDALIKGLYQANTGTDVMGPARKRVAETIAKALTKPLNTNRESANELRLSEIKLNR